MDLRTEFRPIPPEIAVSPLSETPLHNMGLATMIEAALHKAEFETAAEITAWSASHFGVLLGFTPEMVCEVERALGKLGIRCDPSLTHLSCLRSPGASRSFSHAAEADEIRSISLGH